MANQPSLEVQQLLAAEKKASERVAEARKRKAQLLKKAKEEAAAEIEQYKAERQIMFSKYETEHTGSKDDVAKRIDRETLEKLDAMRKHMETYRSRLLERYIEGILSN